MKMQKKVFFILILRKNGEKDLNLLSNFLSLKLKRKCIKLKIYLVMSSLRYDPSNDLLTS